MPRRLAILAVILAAPAARADDPNLPELGRRLAEVNTLILAKDWPSAERAGKELFTFSEEKFRDDPAVRVICHALIASVYEVQEKYQDSERYIMGALHLSEYLKYEDEQPAVQSLNLVALAFQGRGRFAEAERLHKRALKLNEIKFGPQHLECARSLTWLGLLAQMQNRPAEAELYYTQALAVKQATGAPLGEQALGHVSLALVQQKQGRWADSEAPAREGLRLAQSVADAGYAVVGALDALAAASEHAGRLAEAEAHLRRALDITAQMRLQEKPGFISMRQQAIGELLAKQGKLADAESWVRDALKTLADEYGPDNHLQGSALMALARIQQKAGKADDALASADRAIAMTFKPGGSPQNRFAAHMTRAELRRAAGKKDEALADVDTAMGLAEQQRALGSGAEVERAEHFASFGEAFARAAAWRLERQDVAGAFAAYERGRARALVDQFQLAGMDLLAGLPREQANKLRHAESWYRGQITLQEKRLAELASRRDLTPEQRQAEGAKYEKLLAEAQRLYVAAYRDIREASPAFKLAVRQSRQPAALADVQQWTAKAGGLTLVYQVGEEFGHVIVVPAAGAPRAEPLTLSAQQATALGVKPGPVTRARLRAALTTSKVGVLNRLSGSGTAADAFPGLAALWEVLIPAPERAAIAGGKVKLLTVIPEGSLAMLPFEALVVQAGATPKFLLDLNTPVVYAPSATVLLNLASRATLADAGREPVLTVADPSYPGEAGEVRSITDALTAKQTYRRRGGSLKALPFTRKESEWVADYCREAGLTARPLLGADATEANLRDAAAGRWLVHVACHGLAEQRSGNLFGSLALTPGAKADTPADDGFLTLAEMYELNLAGCELAVLSACDTNFGPEQDGEGVWALSRGFLVAGARRVVAGNWEVDDEAAAVLVSGYCGKLAAARKGGAVDYARHLHAAKLFVRQQEKWQSPYFWAPLVLVGPN